MCLPKINFLDIFENRSKQKSNGIKKNSKEITGHEQESGMNPRIFFITSSNREILKYYSQLHPLYHPKITKLIPLDNFHLIKKVTVWKLDKNWIEPISFPLILNGKSIYWFFIRVLGGILGSKERVGAFKFPPRGFCRNTLMGFQLLWRLRVDCEFVVFWVKIYL